MRGIKLFISMLLISNSLYSQSPGNNPFGDKYDDPSFEGSKIVQVIDAASFKPIKLTTDVRYFKSILLQLSQRAYTQINIDTWYLCSYKHQDYFSIYNMYYKPVSLNFYAENCKALIALMLIDGTIKQPK